MKNEDQQANHCGKQCACSNEKKLIEVDESITFKRYIPAIISFVMLLAGIIADNTISNLFNSHWRLIWYAIAYIPVGLPVLRESFEAILKKEFFTEFTLMSIASIGAFILGEYPESVAVMLFYSIGELFQDAAVNKAKRSIKSLLDIRPATATVWRNGKYEVAAPESIQIGEKIQVKVGEKVPIDGEMLSDDSSFNTVELTGESKPRHIYRGEKVLAGMINLDKVIELKADKIFADTSLVKILDLVENATTKKSKTELFIRRFAKVYTPAVFCMAIALVIIPYFILDSYVLQDWIYRALVFLVISCPCALVISIPLGYFGGIGAASRHGILFKGSNYLDLMAKVNTVVMDKTGTLTRGVFKVQSIVCNDIYEKKFIKLLVSLEKNSTHPIAKAIMEYASANGIEGSIATGVKEISGHGLQGNAEGHSVLAGNAKLMHSKAIAYDSSIDSIVDTIVIVAIDGKYAGYVAIADEIKDDAAKAIRDMHDNGIKQTIMLSGDKEAITQKIAAQVGVGTAFGDLLPEGKMAKVEALKQDAGKVVAFVGDGINDAPVLAMSDIGIAMGAMGSEAAIETADVVIQTDQPSKIATAIKIGKATNYIVIQNIALAFGIKAIVLVLGAGGMADMWEAVFADVGVALLAILNSIRILKKRFD